LSVYSNSFLSYEKFDFGDGRVSERVVLNTGMIVPTGVWHLWWGRCESVSTSYR